MPLPRSPNSQSRFTVPFLKSLEPRDDLYEIYEIETKGFGIRVSPKGNKTFFLLANYGGGKIRTRRRIERFPKMSLKEAKATAESWRSLLRQGIDPQFQSAVTAAANTEKYKNTFSVVAEDFIANYLPELRSAKVQAADIRRRFIPVWRDIPITDITAAHVSREIKKIKAAGHKAQAFNSLTEIRTLFSWAVATNAYGLKTSPVAYFNAKMNIGTITQRNRVFDAKQENPRLKREWRAFLRAIGRLEYPYCPLYKLLALTGSRLREIANLHWNEINFDTGIITIPAERMKAKVEHEIPITDEMREILKIIPRFNSGDFLFSVKDGESPITSFTNTKRRIDNLMAEEMQKLCEAEGIKTRTIAPWVIHDIRRSVRTGMSGRDLNIPPYIAARILAHVVGGKVERGYDHHDYNPAKMEALSKWGHHLDSILNPPPSDNIVKLRA